MPDTTKLRPYPRHRAALESARARWQQCFGMASRSDLEAALIRSVVLDEGTADAHAYELSGFELERQHVERYGWAALRAEHADDAERELARTDDRALVRYIAKWTRKFAYLQRTYAGRWSVPALSPDEVRDALGLRLWEALLGGAEADHTYCRAGREWGLQVATHELRLLRRRFRVAAVSVDFWAAPVPERAPNQEQRWIECEAETCRALAHERALDRLTPAQESWLCAFEAAARAGDFFQASQALNLSAASRALGKNRSSALRAYRQLEHEFQRELERFE